MADKAILYSPSKCTACRGCQAACKQWNENDEAIPLSQNGVDAANTGGYENPPELSPRTWLKVGFNELERGARLDWLFTRRACMHCTDASCENVCPTGAIAHHEGFVIIDQEWCIGCGYCVQSCPFQVPHKDEETGTARKCTGCLDRAASGLTPACVKTCPTGALAYGLRTDMLVAGRDAVLEFGVAGRGNAHLYGETELAGLGVLYALDDDAETYGLPASPQLATKTAGGQWFSGVLTAGIISVLPFWWLFRRKERMAAEAAAEITAEQESEPQGGAK